MTGDGGRRPVAVVTGASAGIGRALVDRLAGSHAVFAFGRRPEDEIVPPLPAGVRYGPADLARPEAAADMIAGRLETGGVSSIDRLVLNAGTGLYGDPLEETHAAMAEMLAVNFLAPVLLARRLAPLLEASSGRLTFIGSVAYRGSRNAATYAATKAALDGFARALASEWRGRIAVQIIHPGPVATDMHARAGYEPGRLRAIFLTPQEAADGILRLMEKGTPRAGLSMKVKLAGFFGGRGRR